MVSVSSDPAPRLSIPHPKRCPCFDFPSVPSSPALELEKPSRRSAKEWFSRWGFACLFALILAVFATSATAQDAFQVDDLRQSVTRDIGSGPEILGEMGGSLYFFAYSTDHGYSLWRTDGTPGGQEFVRDIQPGEGPERRAFSPDAVSHNGLLYFRAKDPQRFVAPWVTDGTPEGTFLLLDAMPGVPPQERGSANILAGLGSQMLLSMSDLAHGEELWRTDGTTAGTQFVTDLRPGSESSRPGSAILLGDEVLFFAEVGERDARLLSTDGTAAGTRTLNSEDLLISTSGAAGEDMFRLGSKVFFSAYAPNQGKEVWVSDGTEAGTGVLLDISAGSDSSYPGSFYADGSRLFFQAKREPWISDGTALGTRQIADLNGVEPSHPGGFTSLPAGPTLFGAYTGPAGNELWATDGTAAGTQIIADPFPGDGRGGVGHLVAIGNMLFFIAGDGSTFDSFRLWTSDGTAAGTAVVADGAFAPRSPDQLTAFGSQLIFEAYQRDIGRVLWSSDGTPGGTQPITSTGEHSGSQPRELTAVGADLFFVATDDSNQAGLWTARGDTEGAKLLAAGQGQAAGALDPEQLTSDATGLLFVAEPLSGDGEEIYRTDGTPGGTLRFTDLPSNDEISDFFPHGGLLYIAVMENAYRDLWVSDGTPGGTTLLTSLGTVNDPQEPGFAAVDGSGQILFGANAGVEGRELWISDGTFAGTQLLADLNPGTASSDPRDLTAAGGKIFFSAELVGSRELWVTDGTAAGTGKLPDINPFFGGSDPSDFTPALDKLFFLADDGSSGRELWVSDGTAGGTVQVIDGWPGPGTSPTKLLGEYQGLFWFLTSDGTATRLYSTDGTPGGTIAVKSFDALAVESVTGSGADFNGLLYFNSWDTASGAELWSTDGSTDGTVAVTDINPGHRASNPKELTVAGDYLAFSASDGENQEPWMLPGGDWIFGDGLETLDTSRWDLELVFGAELEVNGDAARMGRGGLEVFVDADQDRASVVDQSPEDERVYRASFFFDPNDMVFPENKRVKIFSTRTINNKRHVETMLRWRAATGYQLRVKAHHENLIDWFGTFWHDIDPEGNQLTIEWQQASAPGAADGVLKLRIDGVLVETVTGIVNGDLPGIEWVQLGVVGNVTPGISGSHTFDDFRSWSSLLP
ncbi:MAG: ELWxxDGT repeat protein [Acidobacteriota bacterium]